MPILVATPNRYDPYKNFKFRVSFEGVTGYVAGISKISALKRTLEVVEHREGGDMSLSRRSPGRAKFEPVTFEWGLTLDRTFDTWASLVWNYQGAPDGQAQSSLANFRRNLIIDVLNEAGQKVVSFELYRCWISEYQALPDLDANANAVAIQHAKVENEGWVQTDYQPPAEPTVNV